MDGVLDLKKRNLEMAKLETERVRYQSEEAKMYKRYMMAEAMGRPSKDRSAIFQDFAECQKKRKAIEEKLKEVESVYVAGICLSDSGGPRRNSSGSDVSVSSKEEEFAGKKRFRRKDKLRSSEGSWRSGEDSDEETVERKSVARPREDKATAQVLACHYRPSNSE